MPNAKALQEKQATVASLTEKMKESSSGIFVDYKGINVFNDTKLRRELREANVDYAVYKNTMLRFAAKNVGFDALDPIFKGTTAFAVSRDDQVLPAKILCEYAKKSNGKFKIKAGFVDGKAISSAEVTALSELPPKEMLLARVVGGLNAPISGLVTVLNGNIRGLAVALNAIREQKQG